jgi:hypothetical protein
MVFFGGMAGGMGQSCIPLVFLLRARLLHYGVWAEVGLSLGLGYDFF